MDKIVLVHLSDIHFMRSSGVSIHDLDANVRNELCIDAGIIAKDIGTITGLLVTGDIAFSGSKAEYDNATEWLSNFCRAIGCPEENVWVVPGNHDVDWELTTRKLTQTLHRNIRKENSDIDKELREIFSDSQSAAILLEPLKEYNTFAGRFGCSISADKYYWERDLNLSCGTIVRLRGLTSALVSNADDRRGDIVLGTAQASVTRATGVFHVTLCHHPPDWLRDQDAVEDHLKSKVNIQLFGHKHSQRLDNINGKVRLIAGATHPERQHREWIPTYNFLELSRRSDDQIGLRIYQRTWSQPGTKFVALRDPDSGKDYHEFFWSDFPVTVQPEKQIEGTHDLRDAKIAASDLFIGKMTEKDNNAMPPPNHERRLTYRFLILPYRLQIEVAQSLNVLTDEDRALSDEALFRELFRRAVENKLLAELWKETENRHTDPATYNPFKSSR
jgi:predicted MPP superfamily phosphohydrolase